MLDDHATATGVGVAHTDNLGAAVSAPVNGRKSFSPNVAYYANDRPDKSMQ